jgi:hypothetical protein
VETAAAAARKLIRGMVTQAPPRDRGVESVKAKARAAVRFGTRMGE